MLALNINFSRIGHTFSHYWPMVQESTTKILEHSTLSSFIGLMTGANAVADERVAVAMMMARESFILSVYGL